MVLLRQFMPLLWVVSDFGRLPSLSARTCPCTRSEHGLECSFYFVAVCWPCVEEGAKVRNGKYRPCGWQETLEEELAEFRRGWAGTRETEATEEGEGGMSAFRECTLHRSFALRFFFPFLPFDPFPSVSLLV